MPDEPALPNVPQLIADIASGKISLFELMTSVPAGDYRAHVEMMRLVGAILSNVGATKAFVDELNQKIALREVGQEDAEQIERQLVQKEGRRRFDKLLVVQAESTKETHSLLTGDDFETCLEQYKKLLSHVETYWASAAHEFKIGNFPIAAFLAILVIEEIGKLGRLYHDLAYYDAPRSAPAPQSVDRDHRRKHFIGVVSGALINARLDRVLGRNTVKKLLHDAESDEFEKMRQACLYVDRKGGQPVTPFDQISREQAKVLVVLSGELMAEVLGYFPWEFERMLTAVIAFEEEIGMPPHKVSRS